jgi:hypothetical protein
VHNARNTKCSSLWVFNPVNLSQRYENCFFHEIKLISPHALCTQHHLFFWSKFAHVIAWTPIFLQITTSYSSTSLTLFQPQSMSKCNFVPTNSRLFTSHIKCSFYFDDDKGTVSAGMVGARPMYHMLTINHNTWTHFGVDLKRFFGDIDTAGFSYTRPQLALTFEANQYY